MLLLLLQLAVATPAAAAPDTGGYATPALRAVVGRAAEANRRVPAALRGWEASAESQIGIIAGREGDVEATVGVEQLASRLAWERPGRFEQRVVGYRAQSTGFNVSALSWFDQGWVIPMLYGNRMALFFGRDSAGARRDGTRRRDRRRERVGAVHPFAEDRDAVYRFAGGDTVATIRVNGRAIPIVRVRVEPRAGLPARTFVFRGDVDLDATRHQIVRLRGQFLVTGGRRGLRDRVAAQLMQALAFVELENQEVAQAYWLPAYQRIELQAGMGPFPDARGIVRIVSRVRDYALDDGGAAALAAAAPTPPPPPPPGDTLVASPHRLSLAPRDSLEAHDAWRRPLGADIADTHARDFVDVAPARLRPDGPPLVEPWSERAADVFRFNRIEGAFTGLGARVRFRDAAPGLTLSATGGWAWGERTARGRVRAELRRGALATSLAAGRSLDLTNDFLTLFDSGATIAALLGRDDFDYVDRRWAAVGARWEPSPRWRLRVETGPARDGMVTPAVTRGLVRPDPAFRANRAVAEGAHWRTVAQLDLAPGVRAELVQPGAGGSLRLTRGDGDLSFDRVEARAELRRPLGPWTLAARAEGGVVRGRPIPPQQLFELGGGLRLPGYAYKEFAGDRAALFGGGAMYTLPVLRAPLRVRIPGWRTVWLPGPAPGLAAGLEGGWTGVSGDAARAAVEGLGTRVDAATGALVPLSRPSERVRLSADLRLVLFGGGLSLGVARAVERGAPLRFVIGAGL